MMQQLATPALFSCITLFEKAFRTLSAALSPAAFPKEPIVHQKKTAHIPLSILQLFHSNPIWLREMSVCLARPFQVVSKLAYSITENLVV